MMRFKEKYNNEAYIISDDIRKIVSVSENGKIYKGNNERGQTITVYKVDGGIFEKEATPRKCDFAIYTNQTDNLYLVELKGGDYSHALEQMISSIEILLEQPQVAVNCVYVRIVLSRSPFRYKREATLKKKLKELNGAYKEEYLKNVSNKKLEEDIK